MNFPNSLFNQVTHSRYSYQPLNQQSCVSNEAIDRTNEENPYNEPAPLAACRRGNLAWLNEELSRDASVVHLDYRSGRNGEMFPLLYVAASNGHINIVKRLIEAGADVNQAIKGGSTPLLIATAKDSTELPGLLIDNGADVNQALEGGTTPLLYAAAKDDTKLARLLIDKGADVNLVRKDGATPLMFAAEKNDNELTGLLIDKGADVNLARKDGATPLMFSAEKGHTALARQLVEQGADVNYSMMGGATPLYSAVRNGHSDTVRLLMEAGANPTKKCITKAVHPHDMKMVKIINTALKQRAVNRTPSEECLLSTNSNTRK